MQNLAWAVIGLSFVGFICYFLIIGGILIWPIVNALAYLKVRLFPSSVRKKYGQNVGEISANDFLCRDVFPHIGKLEELENQNKKAEHALKKAKPKIKALEKERDNDPEIKKLREKISNLNRLKARLGPIRRNKDGSLDKRNKNALAYQQCSDILRNCENQLAKKVGTYNVEINKWRNEATATHNRLSKFLNLANDRAYDVWDEWRGRLGRYLGNRDSLIFMAIGFPVYFLILSVFPILSGDDSRSFFIGVVELYIYAVFVGPVIGISDLQTFQGGISTAFISFEYAQYLQGYYDKSFTFYNWTVLTLPMPFLTICVYALRYHQHSSCADSVMPDKGLLKDSVALREMCSSISCDEYVAEPLQSLDKESLNKEKSRLQKIGLKTNETLGGFGAFIDNKWLRKLGNYLGTGK
jgi:hypothetical protein